MRAVLFHHYGDSSNPVLEEAPVPEPGPGQVLVEVRATSFNPVEAAIRAGHMQSALPLRLPHTPGLEVAGTVAAVGHGVGEWAEGAAVAAFLPLNAAGASAEYVLAPSGLLTSLPDGVDPIAAAAVTAVGLTAWQALFGHGGLRSGQRVLVNGAGGAVGAYTVQLANKAGAEVTATASARSADRVRGYGADAVIDYTATPVAEAPEGPFDLAVHLAPSTGEEADALVALVADGGMFVSATTAASTDPGRGVRSVRMGTRSDAGQLAELLARVGSRELQLYVADRRPLADLPAVHAAADRGSLGGKTVLIL
ncbi:MULTISPECIES: NADP-dependent oxidoreductase [unclassified Streptomyces]|uniref:NADP-dependent oxidoreductase n=1 Tax=unclassified Streptomyces TaxID=2593676 RepID=UPI0036EEC32C